MEIGDHVVPIFNGECQECKHCRSDQTNLCEKFRVNPFKSTMTNDGKCRFRRKDGVNLIYHFLNTSTFSEYTVLDSACAVKIDPEAPLHKMTLLGCGVSTGNNITPPTSFNYISLPINMNFHHLIQRYIRNYTTKYYFPEQNQF